jgi:hypothetical protein
MKQPNRRWVLLLMIGAGTLHQGCFGGGDDPMTCSPNTFGDDDADFFGSCPVPQKPRPRRGTDDEGRVQITANEAWPDRAEEPPHLTAEEIAEGCAAFVACDETYGGQGQPVLLRACLGGSELLSTEREQRAIPWPYKNERFSFLIRETLAARGDCARVRSILTAAPLWLHCEEDGCIATERHEATCEGDVAVFDDGSRRDCSRAYAHCSSTSETGCTDRPFTRCDGESRSRCDGDVKLGCDGCEFVSYRDCAWNGGRCVETEEGAECVPPDQSACTGVQTSCKDGGFERCVFGQKIRVDCGAIGMECADQEYPTGSSSNWDQCSVEGLSAPCTLAHCRAPGQPDGGL